MITELAVAVAVDPPRSDLELVREAYRLHLDACRIKETARSIREFAELLAPDVELVGDTELWCTCRGRRAVTNALVDAAQDWAESSFALEELGTPEPDRVLACGAVLLRPAGTSEVHRNPFAHQWTVKEGQAIRVESLTAGP